MSAEQRLGLPYGDIKQAEQMNFSANLDRKSGKTVPREVPFDGVHVELLYGANSATQNLVGVQLRNNRTGERVFPGDRDTEFVNLADTVHDFTLVFPVEKDDLLEVVYENKDDNSHHINVISTIVQPTSEGRRR